MPQEDAGPRMDPPVSEPRDPMAIPAATDVAEPLLEPPVAYSGFHGWSVWSNRLVSGPPIANSNMATLPNRMLPASSRPLMAVELSVGTRCS